MTVVDPAVLECKEVVEIVSDFLDGALAAGDRARIEQHLLVCPPCAGYIAQVKSTLVQLADLDAAQQPVAVGSELLEAFRRLNRKQVDDDGT
ncbi:MAG TPA: anti-sigma factor [Polyangiaceae bacterium]|nr:anti-sigma factor [Polyangiaceae bacterium]